MMTNEQKRKVRVKFLDYWGSFYEMKWRTAL